MQRHSPDMPGSSTITARCAALSSAITQIIADANSFARLLRDARHDVNTISADLIAIKLSLDICRDDFSAPGSFPALLLEAASDFLDCCSTATEALHKPIVRLSASVVRPHAWNIFKAGDLVGLRQDIEALRSALDLFLDLIILFKDDSDAEASPSSPTMLQYDEHGMLSEHSLLRRIDVEREHMEDLTEGRLPALCSSIERLRACAAFFLEEHIVPGETQKRSDSRSDSLDPATGDAPRSGKKTPPPLPSPTGIGAWIANVVSQIVHSPTFPPGSTILTDPRTSIIAKSVEESTFERGPSQLTFYAESTTSGSRTQSSRKATKTKIRTRVDSPQLVAKQPKPKPQLMTYFSEKEVVSSEDGSPINQRINSNKIASAKDKRRRLTRDQRVAIDWDLRNISRNVTAAKVERIFWEGADPNVEDQEFGSLFIRAAYELSTDVLRLLVEYGADVSKLSSSRYYSAIHAAVQGKQLENLQYLVDIGTSIDMPNDDGETPLHLAVKTPGAYHVARWLLEMGADVNRESDEAVTPLQMAMTATELDSRERSMMAELLLAQGAEGELTAESPVSRGKGLSVLGLI